MTQRRTRLGLWAAVLAAMLVWWAQGCQQTSAPEQAIAPTEKASASEGGVDPASGLRRVTVAELPQEAANTIKLIDQGGPFPYERDGATFENREGLLPYHPMGYYEEYTVETPGEDDRGARRIVAGSGGELYWTEDHYASFERIVT
jgi:ribonuclease T1